MQHQPGQFFARDGRHRELVAVRAGSRHSSTPSVVWRKPGDLWRSRCCSFEAWSRWAKGAQEIDPANLALTPAVVQFVEDLGYAGVCLRTGRGLCGVKSYLHTCAVVFNIGCEEHGGRYCYASLAEAFHALNHWSGAGDPPGLWIKLMSRSEERPGPGGNG
ncbi:hypothetical protein QRD43_21145 [Pelomonas sp. APW6]|uniref:Uncharacterized protein n=1 Tax=Roseateles subflavus TaxID=3053353 RepID=A0ABT7LNH0_9BURK|nr:hypothetical protein [Pelomonas sp. APW6]MDL5034423.1 hypothetical protein [Pelomonas sp. APW6]